MTASERGVQSLTRQVSDWLQVPSRDAALASVASLRPEKLIRPLFSCLCSCDHQVKWHAVSAMGQTIAILANQEMEAARVVMRRFMWMLNDESGGIGWGVPEAIGEVLACHGKLAEEYTHVLVSFMREDGFYLELETLQRGLLWGVAREAEVFPLHLRAKNAVLYIKHYLRSEDPEVIALACLALGRLGDHLDCPSLALFLEDQRVVSLYQDGKFLETTVGAMAWQARESLGGSLDLSLE